MTNRTANYRHYYYFHKEPRPEFYYVDTPLMEKDGFWLTGDLEYTNGSTCKFWIPPGQLRYIEKIQQPDTEEA